jgi:hypothetical protein
MVLQLPGPRVIRRDDLVRTVVTQYDANNNPTGANDNTSAVEQEASESLDAAQAAFQTLVTSQVEYAGLVPISPDGAIQQVQWSGGLSGCVTRASRNSEFSSDGGITSCPGTRTHLPVWSKRRP